MKGYKVFNPDWTCRGFKYEVGKTYKHEGNISLCKEGFHFCKKLSDCFNYYEFDPNNKVAEIEALGNVVEDDFKSVTNEIIILRELTWHEILNLCNTGYSNTGYSNTGNSNTGNWNSTNYSTGFFNSIEQPLYAFNKPLSCTRDDFLTNPGVCILNNAYKNNIWIDDNDMTDEEKSKYPEFKTTGGYLKIVDFKTACSIMWDELTDEEKELVKQIPNFDPEVFKEITGIDVNETKED